MNTLNIMKALDCNDYYAELVANYVDYSTGINITSPEVKPTPAIVQIMTQALCELKTFYYEPVAYVLEDTNRTYDYLDDVDRMTVCAECFDDHCYERGWDFREAITNPSQVRGDKCESCLEPLGK